jgi:hypothetical protein
MQDSSSDICVYYDGAGNCLKFVMERVCDLQGVHENGCWFIDVLPNGERRLRATKLSRKTQQLPLGMIELFTQKGKDDTAFKRMMFGNWSI